ncbi:MAG TPA: helix-turn-helix domain-containing protein, partial [Lachnospiraceae bacterium]|nr:helix-turn-helix domain-containing protein [Lachnospiraceae bacterium]
MVANHVYLSPQYFSKLFKKVTGIGFLNYLTNIRLNHSLLKLSQSDDTILKVAVSNGFANSKAYSIAFKKNFGVLPSAYRKSHGRIDGEKGNQELVTKFDLDLMDAGLDFLGLFKNEDAMLTSPEQVVYINTKNREKSCDGIHVQQKVLLLRHIQTILKAESLEQLKYVQKHLGFSYIYLQIEEEIMDIWFNSDRIFALHQCCNIIEILCDLNLVPIFCLDVDLIMRNYNKEGGAELLLDNILKIFGHLERVTAMKKFLHQCRFEISWKKQGDYKFFSQFVSLFIKKFQPIVGEERIGLLALRDDLPESLHHFEEQLKSFNSTGWFPGFFSFYAVPNKELPNEGYKELYSRMVSDLKGCIRTVAPEKLQKKNEIEIFMMKWDTLMGKSRLELMSFFRPALILDSALSIYSKLYGIGFYLDTLEKMEKEFHSDSIDLALFLKRKIKRPLYFVVEVLNRMGKQIIYQDNQL